MRFVAIFLTILVLLIQYPLWLGKGGILRVYEMQRQVAQAHEKIAILKARNAKLSSEVHDLKEGTGAIEERARSEQGMIKEDEIFIQILDPTNQKPPADLSAIEKTIDIAVPKAGTLH